MAEFEHLNVALPAPIAAAIRRAVETGEYSTSAEVIEDALRVWESRRLMQDRDLEVLRRKWAEGKASGTAGRFDIERLISEERAKLPRGLGGSG